MNKDSYGRVSWDDLSLPPKINAVPLCENKPLKVYQIIKAVGCYEDYHEYIVGTYLHKQKAESELARLKAEVPDCDDCPYSEEGQESPLETNCQFHKPKYINHNDGWAPYYECENCIDPYDAPSYRMKEYEVNESED